MIHKHFRPFLGILLNMLPAIFYGCESTAETAPHYHDTVAAMTKVSMTYNEDRIRTMDIFVFRNDRFQKLDCYQRIDSQEDWDGTVVSGSGERIITAIANSRRARGDWYGIRSRSSLWDTTVSLENETFDSPCMAGEVSVRAFGTGVAYEDMPLQPFVSEIFLNSICCDFTGKPYAKEMITDTKVYLTNVNADFTILEDASAGCPVRIINAGGLQEEDVKAFREPGLIVREIEGDIGSAAARPGIRLWCYPNNCGEETAGTPFTRLVIEGKVSGETYYWPIDINRGEGPEPGIWRNRRYSFDIMITRKGSLSPDIPVRTGDMEFKMEIAEWKEIEEYEVAF